MLMDKNVDTMQYIKAKLVKKNEKLEKVTDWFLDKDEIGGEIGESLTLGTEQNKKVLTGASLIPAAPLAVGVGALATGLVVSLPLLAPAVNASEEAFLQSVSTTGGNIVNFAWGSLGLSLKLAAIPLGIAAISIPKKLFRYLADKVDKKTYPELTNNEKVISLIDDVLKKKDDPTLKLPALFLKRVDLRENNERFNIDLLGHLAYYRHCLQALETGEKTEADVTEAYETFVNFLEKSKNTLGASKNFKNNRFVNMLIAEDGYKEKDFMPAMAK